VDGQGHAACVRAPDDKLPGFGFTHLGSIGTSEQVRRGFWEAQAIPPIKECGGGLAGERRGRQGQLAVALVENLLDLRGGGLYRRKLAAAAGARGELG